MKNILINLSLRDDTRLSIILVKVTIEYPWERVVLTYKPRIYTMLILDIRIAVARA